jgi:flavin reductase (DIM6/NTAB) family NADH-FMN oxidoreductase RutF
VSDDEADGGSPPGVRSFRTDEIDRHQRYQLLTSLVVPRPIAWVSSRSTTGHRNLAPFSYFAALASSPMLIGVAIGNRRGTPKDTCANIRETGSFCVNIVSERQMAVMNDSAGEHPPDVDEFEIAGVVAAESEDVDAPYVADCPAVLACRVFREVDLSPADGMFLIGEVVAVRLSPELPFLSGTFHVDPHALAPVARLGGSLYSLLGEMRDLSRPRI